jgi:hypothetical protein
MRFNCRDGGRKQTVVIVKKESESRAGRDGNPAWATRWFDATLTPSNVTTSPIAGMTTPTNATSTASNATPTCTARHEVVDPAPNSVGRNDRSFSPIEVNAAARRPPRRLGALARVVHFRPVRCRRRLRRRR